MDKKVEKRETDYRFKILYAVGMIMVVAGHCNYGGISLLYEWFPPFSFHLGMFVFVSGYFYNDSAEASVWGYMKHKIKKLLLPLYLWNAAYVLLAIVLCKVGFPLVQGLDNVGTLMYALFLSPVLDGHMLALNLGGWFVAPLIVVEGINVCVRRLLRYWSGTVKEISLFLLYLLVGCVGVWLAEKNLQNEMTMLTVLIVVVVRVLYFIPFYGMGILYRRVLERYDRLSSFVYFSLIFVAQYLVIVFRGYVPTYTPSWGQIYADGLIFPFFVGNLGIALWLRIAKILEPVIGRSKWINLIADNSFSIMINHPLGFLGVMGVIAACKETFGIFTSFDFSAAVTNITYMYCPRGMPHFLIFYVGAGIIIGIVLQKIIDYVKIKFLRKSNYGRFVEKR